VLGSAATLLLKAPGLTEGMRLSVVRAPRSGRTCNPVAELGAARSLKALKAGEEAWPRRCGDPDAEPARIQTCLGHDPPRGVQTAGKRERGNRTGRCCLAQPSGTDGAERCHRERLTSSLHAACAGRGAGRHETRPNVRTCVGEERGERAERRPRLERAAAARARRAGGRPAAAALLPAA
jgi:hypothetical protein